MGRIRRRCRADGEQQRTRDERAIGHRERARSSEGPARARAETPCVHRERESRRAPDRRDEKAERATGEGAQPIDDRTVGLDPARAPCEAEHVPLAREQREQPEGRERAHHEAGRRVRVLHQRVGEIRRIDRRDGEHARERDADDAERDRGPGHRVVREERVEDAEAGRADEQRRGPRGERAGREAAIAGGDEYRCHHDP